MLSGLKALFKSLKENDVKYIVIGGFAAIAYGVPRMTLDLDILIDATEENAANLLKAMLEAGLVTADLITPKNLLEKEITIFPDRIRVDVQISTPGLLFSDAWKAKEIKKYQEIEFNVVSLKDLIASNKASGRPIDLDDVRCLESDG